MITTMRTAAVSAVATKVGSNHLQLCKQLNINFEKKADNKVMQIYLACKKLNYYYHPVVKVTFTALTHMHVVAWGGSSCKCTSPHFGPIIKKW